MNIYPDRKENQLIACVVAVHRDDVVFMCDKEPYNNPTFEDIEVRAQGSPDHHNWKIVLFSAFWGVTYKRIGLENWIEDDKNRGYA